MPRPLDPDVRAAIEDDIRTGGKSRNQIARDHNVSGSTVTNIAKHLDDVPAFDRSHTKRAREAVAEDVALRRQTLADLLLEDVFKIRDRMWASQKVLVLVGVKGGGQRPELMERQTEAVEFKHYLTAIGIAVDKVTKLTEDRGAHEKAAVLLERLMDAVDAD